MGQATETIMGRKKKKKTPVCVCVCVCVRVFIFDPTHLYSIVAQSMHLHRIAQRGREALRGSERASYHILHATCSLTNQLKMKHTLWLYSTNLSGPTLRAVGRRVGGRAGKLKLHADNRMYL